MVWLGFFLEKGSAGEGRDPAQPRAVNNPPTATRASVLYPSGSFCRAEGSGGLHGTRITGMGALGMDGEPGTWQEDALGCGGWKEITLYGDKHGSRSQEEEGGERETRKSRGISRLGSYLEEVGYFTCGH